MSITVCSTECQVLVNGFFFFFKEVTLKLKILDLRLHGKIEHFEREEEWRKNAVSSLTLVLFVSKYNVSFFQIYAL